MDAGLLDDIELPPDVQAELDDMKQNHQEKQSGFLDRVSGILEKKRTEDVEARRNSGIEDVWTAAEEAYIGIDNANRHEFGKAKWAKPMTKEAPVVTNETKSDPETLRSTIYVRLTARYVDAGVAKIQEILLPADDKSFSFDATPDPDLIDAQDNEAIVHENGQPLMRNPTQEEMQAQAGSAPMPQTPGAPAQPQNPATAPGVPIKVKDFAQEAIDLANDKAKKAEKRVYDWLVECQHTKHMRNVIFDAGRIGVGVLKGPVPDIRKAMALRKTADGAALEIEEKLVPVTKWVSPWNLFPDKTCGEDVHNGEHIWERDYLSPQQLRDLKKLPGYIASAIDKALDEGASKQTDDGRNPSHPDADERFEVWYFYGTLNKQDLQGLIDAGNPYTEELSLPEKATELYVLATMVNGRCIHAIMHPLKSGKFPYHVMPWQRRAGHWAGIGISEQVMGPQRMINSATRALMDNAGLSAGIQLIIDREAIEPSDKVWSILRNKIWWKKVSSGAMDDVRKAMTAIQFPDAQKQLAWIIEYAFRLAEESTSIPLITQGQSGKTTPDTYGAARLQDNNANQLLRTIGYSFDDHITEPVVTQFYEWLLMDPDVPDDEKGDWQIFAHGSTSLVERAIQDQTINQWGELVLKGARIFGIDPKKWFAEEAKSKRLDPRKFQYSEAEQQKIDSQPPPPPPQVMAAQVRAQVETQRIQADQQSNNAELQLRERLALLEYANKHQITLEQLKAQLADTTMKLQTQKELNAQDHLVDLHKHRRDQGLDLHKHETSQALTPPTEPPGRAPSGEAFER